MDEAMCQNDTRAGQLNNTRTTTGIPVNRIDLITLRVFTAIADARSLTGAAEREHLALAAVSKRVSDLEEQLGTSLLYRRPRGVELTPAGHALLHHARTVLDNLRQLEADLSEYGRGVRGHVRIHANTSAVIAFLPEELSAFSRAYPHIKIDLEERVSRDIINAVHEGLTDIGIFAGHVPSDELQTFSWRWDRLVLVTPRHHPLAARNTISLAEAAGEDFIGLQQDTSLHDLIQHASRQLNTNLSIRVQVRSFDAICRMIHHGMGVGILPERTMSAHVTSLELSTIPLQDDWARRELKIGVRDYDGLAVIARQMVDHLMGKHS